MEKSGSLAATARNEQKNAHITMTFAFFAFRHSFSYLLEPNYSQVYLTSVWNRLERKKSNWWYIEWHKYFDRSNGDCDKCAKNKRMINSGEFRYQVIPVRTNRRTAGFALQYSLAPNEIAVWKRHFPGSLFFLKQPTVNRTVERRVYLACSL